MISLLKSSGSRGCRGVGEERNTEMVENHKELAIYNMACDAAVKIFEISKKFPVEEHFGCIPVLQKNHQ